MTEINEPIQKMIAWSKEHPALAGGLVIGTIALGYIASKKMNGPTAIPTRMVDDAAGAGILGTGEGDESKPLVPYVDFDPVSGIPVLPTSDDNGGDDSPTYTWMPDIVESVISPITIDEPVTADSSRMSYDVQAIQSLAPADPPVYIGPMIYNVEAIQSLTPVYTPPTTYNVQGIQSLTPSTSAAPAAPIVRRGGLQEF